VVGAARLSGNVRRSRVRAGTDHAPGYPRAMRWTALTVLAALGCETRPILTEPRNIARVAGELRATGEARVDARGGDFFRARLTLDDRLDVPFAPAPADPPAPPAAVTHATLTVRALLADCPPGAFTLGPETRLAYPRCALAAVSPGADLHVGDARSLDGDALLRPLALAGVVTLGAATACALHCGSPDARHTADAVLLATGVAAIAVVAYAFHALAHLD
jgi:hypothetical protein